MGYGWVGYDPIEPSVDEGRVDQVLCAYDLEESRFDAFRREWCVEYREGGT